MAKPPPNQGILSLRVDFGASGRVGPGKINLLEKIEETGSISAAGRSLGMSYRRAWRLIDELNHIFPRQVVEARPGGANGGGARLTATGREIIAHYRAIEDKAAKAAALHLKAMTEEIGAKARSGQVRS